MDGMPPSLRGLGGEAELEAGVGVAMDLVASALKFEEAEGDGLGFFEDAAREGVDLDEEGIGCLDEGDDDDEDFGSGFMLPFPLSEKGPIPFLRTEREPMDLVRLSSSSSSSSSSFRSGRRFAVEGSGVSTFWFREDPLSLFFRSWDFSLTSAAARMVDCVGSAPSPSLDGTERRASAQPVQTYRKSIVTTHPGGLALKFGAPKEALLPLATPLEEDFLSLRADEDGPGSSSPGSQDLTICRAFPRAKSSSAWKASGSNVSIIVASSAIDSIDDLSRVIIWGTLFRTGDEHIGLGPCQNLGGGEAMT